MMQLRGKEIADNSSSDIKLYESLGSLIRNYRQCYKLSQEKFSEFIGISIRELRNWETGRCRARMENLHDLSELTGIPMQVCVALTADQPIWYSLQTRHFSYSFIEAQSLHHELFRYPERPGSDPTIKCESISTDKQINMVLSCHSDIYGTVKPLQKDVIKKASAILPDLNQIVFDSWGHYVGHTIWLPLNKDTYYQLKKQKSLDTYFITDRISNIISSKEGWMLLFSLYVASLNVMHYKLVNDARFLAEMDKNGKYMVAIYSAMTEADELTKNMGLNIAGIYKQEKSQRYNKLYESKLNILMSHNGPWSWLVKELKKGIKDDSLKIQRVNKIKKTKKVISRLKNILPGDIFHADERALIVDNNFSNTAVDKSLSDNQRLGRKNHEDEIKNKVYKNNKLYNLSCPNSNCRLHTIKDKGNIVLNGTYHRKGKKPGRRFLCKECGKSFCNRSGTIFYDLRSPEENILKTLKLLAQGKPLCYVKELLGIKSRTVRRWIEASSEHVIEITALLKNELNMSEIELNSLLTEVKKNLSAQLSSKKLIFEKKMR